jgi:hypothetical protein
MIWDKTRGYLHNPEVECHLYGIMAHFPRLNGSERAPRVRVANNLAIRLSLEGKQMPGVLLVISATGGLAQFQDAVHAGSLAELQIWSKSGPITALVELLKPVKGSPLTMRPFRFIALGDEDQERLNSAIRRMQGQGQSANGWR